MAHSRRFNHGVDKLLELLSQGEELVSACATVAAVMQIMGPDTKENEARYVSLQVRSFSGVPNVKCMADKLRGIASPTRKMVEDAMKSCISRPD
jgi:hypothetical protein